MTLVADMLMMTKAYVYRSSPQNPKGEFYGVGGLANFGLSYNEAKLEGITKNDAQKIASIVNENPNLAVDFIRCMKSLYKIFV